MNPLFQHAMEKMMAQRARKWKRETKRESKFREYKQAERDRAKEAKKDRPIMDTAGWGPKR
jgi:hypothetical protein